mmetsp:Transcript_61773/g.171216  ORF Transcript_61773/g.171216 Transcript_61773/m.171216 type:complete len:337 (-) Transcript_61773:1073-2083(-)
MLEVLAGVGAARCHPLREGATDLQHLPKHHVVRPASEKDPAGAQLEERHPCAPEVDLSVINVPYHDLRRPVVARLEVRRANLVRDVHGAAEVADLYLGLALRHQQVVRLEVPVDHLHLPQHAQRQEDLPRILCYGLQRQPPALAILGEGGPQVTLLQVEDHAEVALVDEGLRGREEHEVLGALWVLLRPLPRQAPVEFDLLLGCPAHHMVGADELDGIVGVLLRVLAPEHAREHALADTALGLVLAAWSEDLSDGGDVVGLVVGLAPRLLAPRCFQALLALLPLLLRLDDVQPQLVPLVLKAFLHLCEVAEAGDPPGLLRGRLGLLRLLRGFLRIL